MACTAPDLQLNRKSMAEDEHREKTHHECKCRDCDPLAMMADRTTAWKNASSLLGERKWKSSDDDTEVLITPSDVLVLAHWLETGTFLTDGDDD